MKIFSTFSGIGGFELGIMKAFWKENVEIIGYSEIDKFSSAVLAHRFPWVKNYGDIKMIDLDKLPDFDVLVGGSPCQDLSSNKNNREGLMGQKSGLFFEYVRILREKKPAFFVLENVASMKNDDKDFISETMGVEPIKINSALLTAQNRNRYYRTNIPGIWQPEDLGVKLEDILVKRPLKKYFIDWQARTGKKIKILGNEETPATLASVRTEKGNEERIRNKSLLGIDKQARNKDTIEYVVSKSKKANCLTGAVHAINMIVVQKKGSFGENSLAVRMPTPIECERLQWFPDNRTLVPWKDRMMSDTQRYKQTWNAVTVDVIQHIFEGLKKHLIETGQSLHSSELCSWLVTTKRKKRTLKKKYILYYAVQPKSGLALESQKAITHFFVKQDKAIIFDELTEINSEKRTTLKKAINLCKKHNTTLLIAQLTILALDVDLIFDVKKKLGDRFKSCDLPTSDRLTLSTAIWIAQRASKLNSIRTKAAFQTKKASWKSFGNLKNLTAEGRRLGIEKIKKNAAQNPINQKVMKIIARCKAADMSFGAIADELNKSGFLTVRGKKFHRTTVKRLFEEHLKLV